GPAAGQGCSGAALDAAACDPQTSNVLSCKFNTALCKVWTLEKDCASQALVCSASTQPPGTTSYACACPANGAGPFYVDKSLPAGAGPTPTGVFTPSKCRFVELGDAVAAANQVAGGAAVLAIGWGTNDSNPVVWSLLAFSQPKLGTGVSVAPAFGAGELGHYVLSIDGTSSASLSLGVGSSVSGFVVQNSTSTGDAIVVNFPTSGSATPASLDHSHIIGVPTGLSTPALATGVKVTKGAIKLDTVEIDHAVTGIVVGTGANVDTAFSATNCTVHDNTDGLVVNSGNASAAGQPVTITGGKFTANSDAGVKVLRSLHLTDGTQSLHIDGATITGGKNGLLFAPSPLTTPITAIVNAVTVRGATDSGVFFNQTDGSTISMTNSAITGNCATTSHNGQLGGGLLFTGSLPAMPAFFGNTLSGNAYNQVLVFSGAAGPLLLSGDVKCGSPNVFVCANGASPGAGVYSTGTQVIATFDAWTGVVGPTGPNPPNAGTDFGGAVDATGASGNNFCAPAVSACQASPTCN
ncbi:MAG TPA: hypothetical protein VF904_12075, partial [Anaeromyxobacteraceae bacterium]